jgi:uncharacterized membrane protein YtjA (UPF0391 family)
MSNGAKIFLGFALISAILGFSGIIGGDGLGLARVAFFIFALFAAVALLVGRDGGT